MSGKSQREFVDTNVLVYAFDASAGDKNVCARAIVKRLWEGANGCLSVQVLQEFFVAVTRRVAQPLPVQHAAERVRDFTAWDIFVPGPADVLRGIALHKNAQLSFWDAMIVHAALESGCSILWTEDLNDGQVVEGLLIRNPFRGGS